MGPFNSSYLLKADMFQFRDGRKSTFVDEGFADFFQPFCSQ